MIAPLTHDRALAADAVQSATCGYLAAITRLSLLLQSFHRHWWIDSAAVACLMPLLLFEARRAGGAGLRELLTRLHFELPSSQRPSV